MNETRLYHLAEAATRGTLSGPERAELEAWRNASPGNDAEYRQVAEILEAGTQVLAAVDPQTEQEWVKLKARSGESGETVPFRNRRFRISAIAAAVLLLAVVGWLTLGPKPNNMQDAPLVYETAAGQMKEIRLADGSTVMLNEGSKLTAEAGFGTGERRLGLEGEAWFDVARDETQPFRVAAGNTVTRVLGTRFNLRAYADEKMVRVNVSHGKVSFGMEDEKENTILVEGQSGLFEAGKGLRRIETAGTADAAWRDGKVVARDEPLALLLPRLEQLYGVSIEADRELLREKVNGTFARNKENEMIEALKLILNCDIEKNGPSIRMTQ